MTLTPDVLAVLSVAGVLVVYIWIDHRQRYQKTDEELEKKASVEMVEALRDEFRGSLDSIGRKVDQIRDTDQNTAVALAEMGVQINRLVAHAESERGTRARADERLENLWIGEVRALRHSIMSIGRRKTDPPETLP